MLRVIRRVRGSDFVQYRLHAIIVRNKLAVHTGIGSKTATSSFNGAETAQISRPYRALLRGWAFRPNPTESVFATVRHRTVRTKGALSQDTARLMVFKLVMAAARTWRRLKGENQLPKVVQGVTFRNGVEVTDTPAQSAA